MMPKDKPSNIKHGSDKKSETQVIPETKMQKATKVYLDMIKTAKRKEIILKFIEVAKLTPAGASTYYTKINKQNTKLV